MMNEIYVLNLYTFYDAFGEFKVTNMSVALKVQGNGNLSAENIYTDKTNFIFKIKADTHQE
jgi:hypothetical protein